jgi:acyl-ACP thioesterase
VSEAVAAFSELPPLPTAGRVFAHDALAGLADTAPSGRVRLDAIARWLQDAAYADVVDAGLERAAVWVVRRMRMRVVRFPRLGEIVRLRTACSGLGRMWAERRTSVAGPHGAIEAVAIWVHLDRESGRPVPFSVEELAVYGTSAGERHVKARLRHATPGRGAQRAPWRFRRSDLDVAGHVNNTAYWQPVEEELLKSPDPSAIDAEIEFRAPAQAGEVELLREGERLWVASPSGELHASIVRAGL